MPITWMKNKSEGVITILPIRLQQEDKVKSMSSLSTPLTTPPREIKVKEDLAVEERKV